MRSVPRAEWLPTRVYAPLSLRPMPEPKAGGSRMRPARRILAIAVAVVALMGSAVSVSASSTPHELHLVKDCAANTGVAPTYCTIKSSNLRLLPPRAKVWYLGPVLADAYFISSNIKIDAWHGNTAIGYCQVDARKSTGICTFWKGTGTLIGFHAVLQVSIDAKGLWHWDGTYYFPGKP